MEVRSRPRERALTAYIARRFYLDGRNKSQIADEVNLSRFKVARLLDEAQRLGIVRIEVDGPTDVDVELAAGLERRFGLSDALVLARPPGDDGDLLRLLGELAAAHLQEVLSDEDVLGVSWGRVLDATATAAAAQDLARITAIQLVGGVRTPDGARSSLDTVQRLGRFGAVTAYPLHAPLVVDDPGVARSVRGTSPVVDTLEWFDRLTVALVGIGSWNPPSSSLHLALPEDDRDDLLAAGAVCDICASVFDDDGQEIEPPIAQRLIAISAAQLRAIPRVIGVAAGASKARAIRAALRTGIVDTLVTDAPTATLMLTHDEG